MLSRSLAIATLLCIGAPIAVADDPDKAPCGLMADYFRDYAHYHPDDPVDSGALEFLGGAAEDVVPPLKTRVSAIKAQSFETRAAAVQAIRGVTDTDGAQQLLEDDGGFDDSYTTFLRDLRPYSNYVILSQTQGTMHCDFDMVFRVEGSRLVLLSKQMEEAGCWTQGLTAIRVGRSAYPAIWEVDNGPSDLAYSVALFNPEDQGNTLCSVSFTFQPNLYIESWYPGKDIDGAFLGKVRRVLEPMLLHDNADAWTAHLEALRPAPTGNDLYDILLRASGESNLQDLLHSMDPNSQMAEIPNAEDEAYTSWGSSDSIPDPDLIEIDHHRLLLFTGQPTFGWREYPDLAFAVWEWNGTKVVPVVSGYLGKRATNPEITVH